MPIAATPDYHYRHPSLQNYTGPVKASQTTAENQYLLLDHQHCSKPITTLNSWPLHTYPNQSRSPTLSLVIVYPPWATQSFTKPSSRLSPLYDHQLSSIGSLRPILANPCLSQPLQTTAEDPDLLDDHQHCSKPTTSFHGHSKLIPTTSDHHHHHPSLQNYTMNYSKLTQTSPDRQRSFCRSTMNHSVSVS